MSRGFRQFIFYSTLGYAVAWSLTALLGPWLVARHYRLFEKSEIASREYFSGQSKSAAYDAGKTKIEVHTHLLACPCPFIVEFCVTTTHGTRVIRDDQGRYLVLPFYYHILSQWK
jgi:hypothetical protein